MNVQQLLEKLSYGPLSNLAAGVEGVGTIEQKRQPQVIAAANDGLTRLYSRFILSEKSTFVTLVAGTSEYDLTTVADPVATDLLRVLGIYSVIGQVLPFNDSADPNSMSIFGTTKLNIPLVSASSPIYTPAAVFEVVYQPKHAVLDHETSTQAIVLPDVLEEALLAYVAAKVYGGMNGQDALLVSQQHEVRFNSICDEAARYGLLSAGALSTPVKFESRGWI